MTVAELKDYLEGFDDDTEVYFAYPSSDYWHTTCANKVEEADMGTVTYSDYHQTYKVVDGNCERDEDDELMDVLILQ